MAKLDRFLVSDDWNVHFGGLVQSLHSKPTSNHFLVLLEGEGVSARGPMPLDLKICG